MHKHKLYSAREPPCSQRGARGTGGNHYLRVVVVVVVVDSAGDSAPSPAGCKSHAATIEAYLLAAAA